MNIENKNEEKEYELRVIYHNEENVASVSFCTEHF
jgi:hypothetical protein